MSSVAGFARYTTAVGGFDDLEAIGALCTDRGVWLHVDGAHGASALLSARHRHRLAGVEHATSLAWDAHKMLLLPLATGVLLVRDRALLTKDVDAITGFSGSILPGFVAQGVETRFFPYASHGVKLYGMSVITQLDRLQKDPALAQAYGFEGGTA